MFWWTIHCFWLLFRTDFRTRRWVKTAETIWIRTIFDSITYSFPRLAQRCLSSWSIPFITHTSNIFSIWFLSTTVFSLQRTVQFLILFQSVTILRGMSCRLGWIRLILTTLMRRERQWMGITWALTMGRWYAIVVMLFSSLLEELFESDWFWGRCRSGIAGCWFVGLVD